MHSVSWCRVGRYYDISSKSSQQALAIQLLHVINLCDITVCAILIALSDIPCTSIANGSQWTSFAVFVHRSVVANFSSENACAICFGYARLTSSRESFLENYSSCRKSFPPRTIRNVRLVRMHNNKINLLVSYNNMI